MTKTNYQFDNFKTKWFGLAFLSPELEKNYRDVQFKNSLIMVRVGALAGIIVLSIYSYLDSIMLGDKGVLLINLRLYFLIPVIIVSLIYTFSKNYIKHNQHVIALNMFLNIFILILALYWYKGTDYMYFINDILLVMMFAYFMLNLRMVNALLLTLGCVLCTIIVLLLVPLSHHELLNAFQSLLMSYGILTVGSYNTELLSRNYFVNSLQLIKQEQQRKELELSRVTWLENMTSFLRHELRNSVTGVKTSVELLRRKHSIDSGDKYLDRAARGTRTIDRLLESVSNATNIESTFIKEKREPVLFSKLLQDQMDSYSQIYPAQVFKANIDSSDIRVLGNEARFIQIIDNLINNAVDHSEPNTAITVSLTQQNNNCLLSIINIGKPLPEDKKGIFDLFTSFRESKDAESKRGFGLYIVRLITESYGGFVEAKHYKDKQGAEFVVSLPVL